MNDRCYHLQGLLYFLDGIDTVLYDGLHDLFGETMCHANNDVHLRGSNWERPALTDGHEEVHCLVLFILDGGRAKLDFYSILDNARVSRSIENRMRFDNGRLEGTVCVIFLDACIKNLRNARKVNILIHYVHGISVCATSLSDIARGLPYFIALTNS